VKNISIKIKNLIAVLFVYFLIPAVCRSVSDSKVLYLIASVISVILVVLLLVYMKNNNMISVAKPAVKGPALIVIIAILAVANRFMQVSVSGYFAPEILADTTTKVTLSYFLNAIIIAPVSEELLYRYAMPCIFLSDNATIRNKITLSIIGTLLWNFRHGGSFINFFSFNISVIVAGLLLYWIFFKTYNIVYCIVFHMFSNLSVLLLFKLDSTSNILLSICKGKYSAFIEIVIFVALFAAVVYVVSKNNKRTEIN